MNVGDYDKWKASFEKNVGLRKEYGSRGAIAFTDPTDNTKVTVIVKAMNKASMARAREDGSFQEAMQEGGMTSEPEVRFLEYVTELDT